VTSGAARRNASTAPGASPATPSLRRYSAGAFCARISASTRRCTCAAPAVTRSMYSSSSRCVSGTAAAAAAAVAASRIVVTGASGMPLPSCS